VDPEDAEEGEQRVGDAHRLGRVQQVGLDVWLVRHGGAPPRNGAEQMRNRAVFDLVSVRVSAGQGASGASVGTESGVPADSSTNPLVGPLFGPVTSSYIPTLTYVSSRQCTSISRNRRGTDRNGAEQVRNRPTLGRRHRLSFRPGIRTRSRCRSARPRPGARTSQPSPSASAASSRQPR
jgi:hypothetical protein